MTLCFTIMRCLLSRDAGLDALWARHFCSSASPKNGAIYIKEAIEIGCRGEAWEEAAGAAYALGLHALHCADYPRAERYYQQSLGLLPREPSEILGKIHAALSIALFRQGKTLEAGTHLEFSLRMRKVSTSSSTIELPRSRALISYMQSARKPHTGGWQS